MPRILVDINKQIRAIDEATEQLRFDLFMNYITPHEAVERVRALQERAALLEDCLDDAKAATITGDGTVLQDQLRPTFYLLNGGKSENAS